ncbi:MULTISPECIES: hypothetical protein [unclassified Streptomyces]|uniref:hypothetical protein n=1 Tax=unclassified Streptomyces TaxID=2593676 RepID=UPI00073CFE94|nr:MULTISPECIES: hypothetical protein [unclassified Streptomyces]ODA70588.1 hypothetical protein APS67_005180 [Streptomyces sp. AVP053U2]
MNDASTNQAQATEGGQTATGHGKHRGPVSQQDAMAAPRGRHRRPAEEKETAEARV